MTHPVDELGDYEFNAVAQWAADQLAVRGACFVDLQPGDATTYKIVIAYPMQGRIDGPQVVRDVPPWVGTSFGPLYPWQPSGHYDWGYVASKWVRLPGDTCEWTARVICRFLNTLSDKMKEASDG